MVWKAFILSLSWRFSKSKIATLVHILLNLPLSMFTIETCIAIWFSLAQLDLSSGLTNKVRMSITTIVCFSIYYLFCYDRRLWFNDLCIRLIHWGAHGLVNSLYSYKYLYVCTISWDFVCNFPIWHFLLNEWLQFCWILCKWTSPNFKNRLTIIVSGMRMVIATLTTCYFFRPLENYPKTFVDRNDEKPTEYDRGEMKLWMKERRR